MGGLAILLCSVVFPAWKKFILPTILEAEEAKEEEEKKKEEEKESKQANTSALEEPLLLTNPREANKQKKRALKEEIKGCVRTIEYLDPKHEEHHSLHEKHHKSVEEQQKKVEQHE